MAICYNSIMVCVFKTRLKELRLERNLSQTELAKCLQVSQATIGKWETGDRKPDLESLMKISVFFGVSADYLLGLRDTIMV